MPPRLRNRVGRVAACALAMSLVGLSGPGCAGGDGPERIVLIVIDTLRADYESCCGVRPATPTLDALAARGQRVDRAYGSYHQTTMSMGALFTGRTPSLEAPDGELVPFNGRTWCGMARFAAEEDAGCLPGRLRTLGERMAEAGYETLGIASNELLFAPSGFERGFEHWFEVADPEAREQKGPAGKAARHRGRTAERVNEAVRQALAGRRGDHFFLYVHYMDVHDYEGGRPAYAEAVERADAGVGSLLTLLEGEGLLEDAVVILTSDHGERIGEEHVVSGKQGHWGQPSFEEVLRVPLIVAPAMLPELGPLVRTQDLYGIVTGLAGLSFESPEPVLAPDELLLTEGRWRTYRRGRWKTFNRRNTGVVYLIDLEADPGELYNVAPLNAEVVNRHLARGAELAEALAAREAEPGELTEEDQRRLRALGYLD